MKKNLLFSILTIAIGNYAMAQCVTPPPPSSVTASPNKICSASGGTTNLNASTTGAGINWYTVPAGGSPLGFSNSGANFSVNAVSTTTYYAEAIAFGGTVATTFSYTGGTQTFVVPAGVSTVQVEAWGAQGNFNALNVAGGLGGYAKGTMTVTPGSTLYIEVGGGGISTSLGGYNGGAIAGPSTCTGAIGGGGGGASDVRVGGTALVNRMIVGAGGGGAAGDRINACGRGTGGGGGGGYYGGGGGAAWPSASLVVPLGGDQVAGGLGGTSTYASAPGNNGSAGVLGIGGAGGAEVGSNQGGAQTAAVGGVGGGTVGAIGIYAGNFSGQSGAGGSSFLGSLTSATTTSGIRTGNGQVILTFQNSCPNTVRIPVTVTVAPTPTISVNSGTICAGTSLTLAPSGASTYTFQGGSAVVSPTANATYTVIGTNSAGCVSATSATANVTVNASPVITVNSGTVCSGTSLTLTPSGATTYTFQGGSAVVTPTASTSYTVIGTATNGCVSASSATANVTVNASPVITVNSGTVCAGSSLTLTPGGASIYTVQGGSTVVTPTASTSYTVVGTSSAGCVSASSATANVTVNALPNVNAVTSASLICSGSAASLTASGATTYNWSTSATTAVIVVSPTTTTSYTVTGTSNGCNKTFTITQNVSPCTGINSLVSNTAAFNVYPNPTNGVLNVTMNVSTTSDNMIQIVNTLGKVIYNGKAVAATTEIDLRTYPAGIYFVKVKQEGQEKTIKVIKD